MFGNKQPNPSATPSSLISNRINHGTTFEGSITSDGDVRIEGVIKGTLHTKARVAVGQTGVIEGDVYCKTAEIEGRITGDLEVSEVLTLKASAIVEGNIYTAKIVIENGAHFDGVCNMGTKDRKITNVATQYEEAAV